VVPICAVIARRAGVKASPAAARVPPWNRCAPTMTPVVAAHAIRQTVCKEVSYAAVRRPLQVHRRRREEHP
jgi:hypothetical protein